MLTATQIKVTMRQKAYIAKCNANQTPHSDDDARLNVYDGFISPSAPIGLYHDTPFYRAYRPAWLDIPYSKTACMNAYTMNRNTGRFGHGTL